MVIRFIVQRRQALRHCSPPCGWFCCTCRCRVISSACGMADTTGLTGGPQPPPRTVRQEIAPKGGYAPINVARNVPKSIGNGAGLLLVGTAAMMSYGFYRLGTFNVKRRYVLVLSFQHSASSKFPTVSNSFFHIIEAIKQDSKARKERYSLGNNTFAPGRGRCSICCEGMLLLLSNLVDFYGIYSFFRMIQRILQ